MASLDAFWYNDKVRAVVWVIIRAAVVIATIATIAALV